MMAEGGASKRANFRRSVHSRVVLENQKKRLRDLHASSHATYWRHLECGRALLKFLAVVVGGFMSAAALVPVCSFLRTITRFDL